jgi:hypothetical protein
MNLKENMYYITAKGHCVGPIRKILRNQEEFVWARWSDGIHIYEITGLPRNEAFGNYPVSEWNSSEWNSTSFEGEAKISRIKIKRLEAELEASDEERIRLRKEVALSYEKIRNVRADALRQAAEKADEHYINGDMGNPGHWIMTELF